MFTTEIIFCMKQEVFTQTLFLQPCSSKEFSSITDFVGISYLYFYEYDNICYSILGLNFLYPSYNLSTYNPLYESFGINKVIGLHLPYEEISLNGYVSLHMNGSIVYYNIYDDSSYRWKSILEYFIDEAYKYTPYSPILEFSMAEEYMNLPYNDYTQIVNLFCNSQVCYTFSYGDFYSMTYATGNSSKIMDYSFGNIDIYISKSTKITLYPSDYLSIGYNMSNGMYYAILLIRNFGNFHPWILGNMVLKKLNLILDGDKRRIGFVSGHMVTWLSMLLLYIGSGIIVIFSFIIGCYCCKRKRKLNNAPLIQHPSVENNITLR